MEEKKEKKERDFFPVKNPLRSMDEFFFEKPFKQIVNQMDEFFRAPFFKPSFRAEMEESEDKYQIYAELPGIQKEQIHIDINQNTITIRVKHTEWMEEKDHKNHIYKKEASYGNMSRAFTLPHLIDSNKVKATFKNGLLSITIPKKKGKRIVIDG